MTPEEKYAKIAQKLQELVSLEPEMHHLEKLRGTLRAITENITNKLAAEEDAHRRVKVINTAGGVSMHVPLMEHNRQVADKHEHASGVTRSHKAPGYHHIPYDALECAAQRFDSGLVNRRLQGKPSWQDNRENTLADPEFYVQALDHMQEHLSKLSNRDFSEDDEWGHIGAILWGASVWAWYVRNRKPSTGEGGT